MTSTAAQKAAWETLHRTLRTEQKAARRAMKAVPKVKSTLGISVEDYQSTKEWADKRKQYLADTRTAKKQKAEAEKKIFKTWETQEHAVPWLVSKPTTPPKTADNPLKKPAEEPADEILIDEMWPAEIRAAKVQQEETDSRTDFGLWDSYTSKQLKMPRVKGGPQQEHEYLDAEGEYKDYWGIRRPWGIIRPMAERHSAPVPKVMGWKYPSWQWQLRYWCQSIDPQQFGKQHPDSEWQPLKPFEDYFLLTSVVPKITLPTV